MNQDSTKLQLFLDLRLATSWRSDEDADTIASILSTFHPSTSCDTWWRYEHTSHSPEQLRADQQQLIEPLCATACAKPALIPMPAWAAFP